MMCVVFYLFTFFGLFLPTDMLTSARNFQPANGQKYNLAADMAHHIHQDLDICPWTNLCKAQLEIKNASRCSCIMLHHHSSAWPQPWSKVFLGNLTKDLAHSSSYPVHSLWKPEVADNDRNACVVFLPARPHVSVHVFAIACVCWSACQLQLWERCGKIKMETGYMIYSCESKQTKMAAKIRWALQFSRQPQVRMNSLVISCQHIATLRLSANM